MKRMFFVVAAAAIFVSLAITSPAYAATHEVQMLNRNPDNAKQRMVFLPSYLQIAPGDTVIFKAVDKGHNTVSIKGMIPEGATPWKSKMNKDFEVTLKKEGVYGYKCMPHFGMGMVGVIQVGGDIANLETAKGAKMPGKAKKVFDEIFAEMESGE
ncbi:MAG: pseudoazurin [Robiginitomaculum sp.]|nr:pseudoazurin [Robiginitomaculum sp.]